LMTPAIPNKGWLPDDDDPRKPPWPACPTPPTSKL
jgi:hypothetical protein